MRQPLYDNKSITPSSPAASILTAKIGDGYIYLKVGVEGYHKEGEPAPKESAWSIEISTATGFETSEAAENAAFEFVATRPHFIGHIEIRKVKLKRPRETKR
jgi:hypothetical protein